MGELKSRTIMGLRQEKLKSVIEKLFTIKSHPKPTIDEMLNSKYSDLIFNTYKDLNGQLDLPPTRFGKWDISTEKFVIELDEERHFNRYRLQTLDSAFYKSYNNFSVNDYQTYCKNKEADCLKAASWSKNWRTNSTQIQFGLSDKEGAILNYGSSRWKQRAYYDFLKDVSSSIMNIPILRISIYDTFDSITVDKLLRLNNDKLLEDLIAHRTR